MNQNPYEAPQSDVPPQAVTWREKLAALQQQSRVSWGATLCFWALAVYLIFNIGSSLMMQHRAADSTWLFYAQLRYWGTWGAVILHAVGLFLFCFIGEQTRAKTFFKLALGCFVAYQAWQWLPHYESLDEQQNAPIPPTVEFLAQLTWIISPLLIFVALRRVSSYCQDRWLLRWSFVALILYSLMALLQIGFHALLAFELELSIEFWMSRFHGYRRMELLNYTMLMLGFPVAYCYGRMLRRVAVLWEQTPAPDPLQALEQLTTDVTPELATEQATGDG